jgi:hypothetical protein
MRAAGSGAKPPVGRCTSAAAGIGSSCGRRSSASEHTPPPPSAAAEEAGARSAAGNAAVALSVAEPPQTHCSVEERRLGGGASGARLSIPASARKGHVYLFQFVTERTHKKTGFAVSSSPGALRDNVQRGA